MESKNGKPLTTHEFDEWATATKQTLNSIDDRLASVEKKLEPLERIATSLKRIEENTGAMLKLYRRLDRRTVALADHVHLDLRKVDAEM